MTSLAHATSNSSSVLYRKFHTSFPIIQSGQGLYLYDTQGNCYLDASSGAFVVSAGHSHPEMLQYLEKTSREIQYVNGLHFSNSETEKLASRLAQLAKPLMGASEIAFLCSGSEAIEAACKCALQFWQANHQPQRTQFISRQPSYHGNTLLALSLSGRPRYKLLFPSTLLKFPTIPTPYRYHFPHDYEKNGSDFYLKPLKALLDSDQGNTIAALVIEPISGSSCVASVPPADYFPKLQALCKKHHVLIIADEILCGSGRTGTFFASSQVGLKPDLLTLGKGLSSGYRPLSAVFVQKHIMETIASKATSFSHAQTFMHTPCIAAAGNAFLNIYEKENLFEKTQKNQTFFLKILKKTLLPLPYIGHIEGRGLLIGIELVQDKTTKKPFSSNQHISSQFGAYALKQGLVLWTDEGHIDGINGNSFFLAPPLISSQSDLSLIVEKVLKTLKSFMRSFR